MYVKTYGLGTKKSRVYQMDIFEGEKVYMDTKFLKSQVAKSRKSRDFKRDRRSRRS